MVPSDSSANSKADPSVANEVYLIERLREGDAVAFSALLEKYHAALVRFAEIYVPDHATAEYAARVAWKSVVHDISHFDGTSSFKIWIYRTLIDSMKSLPGRVPSPLSPSGPDVENGPSVDPSRFNADGEPGAGHWIMGKGPRRWGESMQARLREPETIRVIERAIERLNPTQRAVMLLRDLQGWSAEEVSSTLKITGQAQRHALHHARARVRSELERYFTEGT